MFLKQRALAFSLIIMSCGWAGSSLQFYLERTLQQECSGSHERLFTALALWVTGSSAALLLAITDFLFKRYEGKSAK